MAYLSEQLFFIAFANQWAQNIKPESVVRYLHLPMLNGLVLTPELS